jgi:hypothetical protein
MAEKTIPPAISVIDIVAGEALAKNRFVNAAGAYVASAGDRAVGTTLTSAASGDAVSVQTAGVVFIEAGGAITIGQAVQSTDAGKATAIADPTASVAASWKVLGEALEATTSGDGDIIRIRLI